MNRILAFAFAALAALLAPAATAQRSEQVPAAPGAQRVWPALWRVADEDTTIYLFGTVHALPPGVDWYHGEVSSAFESSQELVTEVVDEDPVKLRREVSRMALLPRGKSLRGLLSADEKRRYDAALVSLGMAPAALDPFEPWYAAINLSIVPALRDGFNPADGVEKVLGAKATSRGYPHRPLESAVFQLGLFDALPATLQKHYLVEVIDNLPSATDDLRQIVDAWKSGDSERLAALMQEQEDDPVLLESLIYQRNRNWADWIRARLDRPGVIFLAVGAGHLAGHGSVQSELAARGIASARIQ